MKQNLIRWGLCMGITVVFQTAMAQETERKAAFDNYCQYALEASKPTDKAKEQAILSYGITSRKMVIENLKQVPRNGKRM